MYISKKGVANESLLLYVRPGFYYLRTWYSVLRGEHLHFRSIQLEPTSCRQLSTYKFTSFLQLLEILEEEKKEVLVKNNVKKVK